MSFIPTHYARNVMFLFVRPALLVSLYEMLFLGLAHMHRAENFYLKSSRMSVRGQNVSMFSQDPLRLDMRVPHVAEMGRLSSDGNSARVADGVAHDEQCISHYPVYSHFVS